MTGILLLSLSDKSTVDSGYYGKFRRGTWATLLATRPYALRAPSRRVWLVWVGFGVMEWGVLLRLRQSLPPFLALAGLKAKIIHKKEKKKEHLQERYTLQLATS